MTQARLAEIEAAIARDERTNPSAYYEYQGTIDEAHTRRQLAHDDSDVDVDEPREFDQADFDAFRADPKRQALVKRILSDDDDDDVTLPTGGPAVNYGAAGI